MLQGPGGQVAEGRTSSQSSGSFDKGQGPGLTDRFPKRTAAARARGEMSTRCYLSCAAAVRSAWRRRRMGSARGDSFDIVAQAGYAAHRSEGPVRVDVELEDFPTSAARFGVEVLAVS
jgi:hypothetical protein